MLKKYRRRFIRLNLTMVGIVLLAMVSVIGIYMIRDQRVELYDSLKEAVRPHENIQTDRTVELADGTEITRSEMSVLIAEKDGGYSMLSNGAAVDEGRIDALVAAIDEKEEDFGLLRGWNLYYYCSGGHTDNKISLVSSLPLRHNLVEFFLMLGVVFCGAMVLFGFVSLWISGLAVRPLEDSWNRERRFIADVSHELKTPLAVILANNSILRSNPDSRVSEQLRWIDSTESTAESMRDMVEQMLSLSELEAADQPASEELVDLSDAVMKAALFFESVAYDRRIRTSVEVEDGLRVFGCREYVSKVINILIDNAIKYEPADGTVALTLAARRDEAVFTVTNRGAVIDPEVLPHLFERFFRAGPGPGHGLGLPIAAGLAEKLRGSIHARSAPETGTVFTLTLPLGHES